MCDSYVLIDSLSGFDVIIITALLLRRVDTGVFEMVAMDDGVCACTQRVPLYMRNRIVDRSVGQRGVVVKWKKRTTRERVEENGKK